MFLPLSVIAFMSTGVLVSFFRITLHLTTALALTSQMAQIVCFKPRHYKAVRGGPASAPRARS
jgi:hypothetical protein